MLAIDHVRIGSRNPSNAAAQLSIILDLAPPRTAGREGEMSCLDMEGQPTLLFDQAEAVGLEHIAFRVDRECFDQITARLKEHRIEFGNHPDDPRNGRTDDWMGREGRVFFVNPDGHLFEVFC